MSALCQDSLAWQQNINCFQLAEFPSFSCGCSQSEASLVKQSTFTVATAPLYLIYASHTVHSVFVRWLKLHANGGLAVPSAEDNVNPHLAEEH